MSDRWTVCVEEQAAGRWVRMAVRAAGTPVSYAAVVRLWQDDAAFRGWFNAALAAAPFVAYRWETPPVTAATAGRPFEFVLVNDPALDRPADRAAFADHFAPGAAVVTFRNLGGDAVLVVPCPLVDPSVYPHLAVFVRGAPETQRHALWQQVGQAAEARLGDRPVWISTAGAGVPWLHVRLDDRPKYYHHRPYQIFRSTT